MTKRIPLRAVILSTFFSTSLFADTTASTITLAQVTEDVSYLASDKRNGRGNFSTDIQQAADYIANRFKEAGLLPVAGNDGYYQRYTVTNVKPNKLTVNINGESITADKLALASTLEYLSLTLPHEAKNTLDVKVTDIGQHDNFRTILGQLNTQGGQHLVLLHPSHKNIFTRYQHYFAQGLTKLTETKVGPPQGGSLVMVLTDMTSKQLDSLTVKATNTISRHELTNVVAMLPGKNNADEIVLYSAHYDHLGTVDDTDATDTIYNGADDDASGTAAIINLAQYFAQQGKNERSLLFAAFSAEEIGGFGSRYFSQQLDANTITAMINIEMIGKPSKFGAGTMWMTGMDRSDLGAQLNAALNGTGMEIYKDPYPKQKLFYRSDNATLARLGVPAHSFSSTQLDKDLHYHQVSDDLASLDLVSLHQVINALAVATQPLVDGKITPTRIDTRLVKKQGLIY